MTITFNTADEAIAELQSNPNAYKTQEALRGLLAKTSTYSTGNVTILYSGGISTDGAVDAKIKSAFSKDPNTRMIGKTAAFDLLESEAFKKALANVFGETVEDLEDIRTSQSNRFLNDASVNGVGGGLWDDVSRRFISETTGEIRNLTGLFNFTGCAKVSLNINPAIK